MADNVRIPVDLDTKEARAKLKQLKRDKERARKRITTAARRTSRVASRAFAFTGAAAVIGKFQNNEPSGNVDIVGEAFTPIRAMAQQVVDEGLGFSAKARTSAREQTKAAFAITVGRTGELAGARDFYDTVERIQKDVESGRNLIRQDPRFLGPDLGTVTKAAIKGNLELFVKNLQTARPMRLLMQGFDYIVEGIKAD